ncbi:MAG: M18 family aminopeptidase [Porticoccus sp.]|nr:M18 family aminopeptidase [Porticoccus sp.]
MNQQQYNQKMLDFIQQSPTPFHAVETMKKSFDEAGFQALAEGDHWSLVKGGRYYVTRNGSSIIAFVVGSQPATDTGIRLVGAHTDSPCLKVKPTPELYKHNYFQLGVEVYGGALLNPWFDRDLSIAGRVVFKEGEGELQQSLIDLKKPVAVIPSLAIHLDREANDQRKINPQTDIPPILFKCTDRTKDFRSILAQELIKTSPEAGQTRDITVMDYDLYFYDCQPPALTGLNEDFISSARLDNLLSCFTGMQALLNSQDQMTGMLICSDHEEVGSTSATGANGPMLKSVLKRLYPDAEMRSRILSQSLLVSTDNAHGIHPNFSDKHDGNHGPVINEGPVIKINANQRYATNSVTSSLFRHLCEQQGVPVQSFVNRADMGCGSTIGPITAANIGVQTLDVGVPTFAMHSIREFAGVEDAHHLFNVLQAFYNTERKLVIN